VEEHGVLPDELDHEATKRILTVDSPYIRGPSSARLGEERVVENYQKMGTRDVQPELHCFVDAIQNYMNEIHRKVRDDADY